MNNTKYSVLMSIYHKEKPAFFIESIESMLRQTIKPDEIVIVKDGPLTSELDQVINKYTNQEPRLFTIVPLEKNLGLGLALNEGLKRCRNELVARMDTDDISLENRCELQLREFNKNPELCIVGTQIYEFVDNINNIVSSRIVPVDNDSIIKFSRRRSPFNHPTVMYKRSMILKMGGYSSSGRKEDLELFIRMIIEGCNCKNLDSFSLLYRADPSNLKRRKTWKNCSEYISVMFEFYKIKHLRFLDFAYVVVGQLTMFITPLWATKYLSKKFLRNN